LKDAGLGDLIHRVKLTGAPRVAIGNLVDFLARWGTVEGQEALLLLLFALFNETGEDGQSQLQLLIDRLSKTQKNLPDIAKVHSPTSPEDIPEKLIGEPTLQPLSFLEHALELAKRVAFIAIGVTTGTGFLISPRLLLTNNHVLPTAEFSENAIFRFNYQQNRKGEIGPIEDYRKEKTGLFYTNIELDYTIIELSGDPGKNHGFISTEPGTGIRCDERVNIIQHPGGRPKQISFRNNFVEYADNRIVQYVTHTEPGSSGSPVFNDRWELVAVHHAGGIVREPSTQRRYSRNEGIAIQAILGSLPEPVHKALSGI
jgi:V8-like Glu-specific endopeptidase